MIIFVCIDFSVCFCLPWLFACVCVCACLPTDVCVCVSGSVWEHVIWVHWYTRTHMPCVGTLCLQSDGVWAGARTKLCTGGLSLQLKSAPWSKPSPLRAGHSPPSILSPTLTLDSKPDARPPCHHGHTAWHFGERGWEIVLRDRRDADGPVETRSLWSHKNERYGQTVHLLEWPSFWWSALVSGDFYCPGNGCLYIHGVYGQYNHVIPHNHIIRIMWPWSVIPLVGWVLQHDWHLKINLLVGCTHRN